MNRARVTLAAVLFLVFFVSFVWADQPKPIKMVPMKVIQAAQVAPHIRDAQLITRLPLQAMERQNVDRGTKLLINQQFGTMVNQSMAVTPKVNVLGKVGNRIQAEAIIVFQDKNTYTATLSKLEYDVEGEEVFLKRKTDNYRLPVGVIKTPLAVNPSIVRMKADLLKNLKLSLPQGFGPKGLANTPCNDIDAAVTGTNKVHDIFIRAFGLDDKKIGNQSTKGALLDVLRRGTRLLAWNNIGHGNPDTIIEWNGDTLSHLDFNTTTPFEGVYNAVILLNSCDTCATPFSLKNAILKHKPRTFIAGNRGLPIGRSEDVDVIFWDHALLQNKTMGASLADGENAKGLQGYFCLVGHNGKFADVEAAKFTEDCIPFNYNQVQAQNVKGRWKVVQGNMWMLDFGGNKANADKAVAIMKHYKLDKQCFVGRPHAPMQYYTAHGAAPQGSLPGEDCIPFNPNNTTAQNIGGRWLVVDGSHSMLNFDNKEAEARIAVSIIKFYAFNQICFVGRPNAPMTYFKR